MLRKLQELRSRRCRRALAVGVLLIQARHIGADDEILVKMITEHLGNLEKKNYQAIARDLKEPLEEIYEAAKVIMGLDPQAGARVHRPKSRTTSRPTSTSTRSATSTSWCRTTTACPSSRSPASTRRRSAATAQGASEYIQDKLRSAQWLIRSIQQRQRTIVKVTESIIKFQREFFEKGIAHLKPLILRDVAEDISMHESTISRVTTNKYVHTPQGIFELKYFFNSGIRLTTDGDELASEAVKTKIKQLIATEDPQPSVLGSEDRRAAPRPDHRHRPPHRRQVSRAARHP